MKYMVWKPITYIRVRISAFVYESSRKREVYVIGYPIELKRQTRFDEGFSSLDSLNKNSVLESSNPYFSRNFN